MTSGHTLLTGLGIVVALALPAPALAAPRANSHELVACSGAHDVLTEDTIEVAREATLCLINAERQDRGRVALRPDDELQVVAVRYSRTMVREGFFGHVSPGGSTHVERVRGSRYLHGVGAWLLGENLAWGAMRRATPARTLDAWMRSDTHRANILEPRYRHIGIGLVLGAPVALPAAMPAATYTTEFGAHLGSAGA